MHCDNDVFLQAIQQKRKIQLAFFTERSGLYQSKLYVPLGYSPASESTKKSACYYFWDQQTDESKGPLVLSADEIAVMQMTQERFDPADLPSLDSVESLRPLRQDGR